MLINSELTQISWRRGDSGSVTAEELVRGRAATLMRFGIAPCVPGEGGAVLMHTRDGRIDPVNRAGGAGLLLHPDEPVISP